MKRDWLKSILPDADSSIIDQIMNENGKDIESHKAQLTVKGGLVNDLTAKLEDANNKLAEFSKVDINALTSERDSYKTQYEQALKDKDTAVESVRREAALDSILSGHKFTSDFARNGIKSLILEKDLKFNDGKFEGIDDVMNTLITEHSDAFVQSNVTRPVVTSSIQSNSQLSSDAAFAANRFKNNPFYKQ